MSGVSPINCFERLPDELFLEIFSYVDPLDLVNGFVGLNNRINGILKDVSVRVQLLWDDDFNSYMADLSYFASQIVHLSVDDFAPPTLDLRPLSNLHSLHLRYLSFAEEPIDRSRSRYLSLIRRQPHLKVIVRYCVDNDLLFERPCPIFADQLCGFSFGEPCLSLRSLRHDHFTKDTFNTLAHLTPNLISLDCFFCEDLCREPFRLIQHRSVRHLRLRLICDMTTTQLLISIDSFLDALPNVQRFYLILKGQYKYLNGLDFEQLVTIVYTRIPCLQRPKLNLNELFKFTPDFFQISLVFI